MSSDNPQVKILQGLQIASPPSLSHYFNDLITLTDRKLWHQVTMKLEDLVRDPNSNPIQIELFNQFIEPIRVKFNPLKYVTLALATAQNYPNAESAVEFLTNILNIMDTPNTKDAYILARMEIANQILSAGSLVGVKAIVEECELELEKLPNVDTLIYAHFYRVAADFYKGSGSFTKYYYNSLLYLSCINIEDLSIEEKIVRAYDLSLSALLGEDIYNFGELLMHPISEVLKGTEHEWLYNLLLVFNSGSIGKFDSLTPHFSKQALLEAHFDALKNKIILMGLVEFLFQLKTDSKVVKFQLISQECLIPITEVEHLIMRALSLGLIKGLIDQVDNTVTVHWVQPRYLDKAQLRTLDQKLNLWIEKVKQTDNVVNLLNPELLNPQ